MKICLFVVGFCGVVGDFEFVCTFKKLNTNNNFILKSSSSTLVYHCLLPIITNKSHMSTTDSGFADFECPSLTTDWDAIPTIADTKARFGLGYAIQCAVSRARRSMI